MERIGKVEMKKIQIELLAVFDNFCRKNKLQYSLINGSLIGAIRHNGMIPWDDDIDVIMDRSNYEKFKELFNKTKIGNACLLSHDYSNQYTYPFGKLVDTRTYMTEQGVRRMPEMGAYIDILIYDYMPDTKFFRRIHYLNILVGLRRIFENNVIDDKRYGMLIHRLLRIILNSLSPLSPYDFYEKIRRKFNKKACKYIIPNWIKYGYNREIQEAKYFTEFIDWKFESINVMITKDYDKILRNTFGDYMKFPPVKERVPHHHYDIYWRDNESQTII